MTDLERFLGKFHVAPNGCWLWDGAINSCGYGNFYIPIDGKPKYFNAHHAAWMLYVGPVPDGFDVHHKCHNRKCVNPKHLECISPKEHNGVRHAATIELMAAPRRALTHCCRGHEFDPQNTGRTKEGRRYCKKCRSMHSNNCQKAKRALAKLSQ